MIAPFGTLDQIVLEVQFNWLDRFPYWKIRGIRPNRTSRNQTGRRVDPQIRYDQRFISRVWFLARAKTASSIASVSVPVNVFCWLG